jgi:glycosyltransferase involved in cell wall biosynthesis
MKAPLVSVIIPLYNHERFVKNAINSVLRQSLGNLEVIVINDGSTDRSGMRVRQLRDPRIRYLTQPNRGAHHALNRGARLARGKYLSILNSDDIYHPRRLERFVKICEAEPSIDACFSHIEIINARGMTRGYINGAEHNDSVREHRKTLHGRGNVLLDLLGGNFLATTSNLFCRRSAFLKAGPFKAYRYAHDYEFFLRLCAGSRVRIVRRHLLKYRDHRNNTIKESRAATRLEHALILTHLFCGKPLQRLLREKQDLSLTMTQFFNSLETFGADKIILVLLLFLLKGKHRYEALADSCLRDNQNLFCRQCIEYLEYPDHRGSPKERIVAAIHRLNQEPEAASPVYLFGTGEFSRIVYRHLQKRRIAPIGYFDNNPDVAHSLRNNLPVELPRRIDGIKVIIASSATRPIYRQLRQLGYPCRDIVVLK